MDCKKCGMTIEEDAKFCKKCGPGVDLIMDGRLSKAEKKIDISNISNGFLIGVGSTAGTGIYLLRNFFTTLSIQEGKVTDPRFLQTLNSLDIAMYLCIVAVMTGIIFLVYNHYGRRCKVLNGDLTWIE